MDVAQMELRKLKRVQARCDGSVNWHPLITGAAAAEFAGEPDR
jgi:hypothetical protein